jgi:AraC-like DNA-binding protein
MGFFPLVARTPIRHRISLMRQPPAALEFDPKRGVSVATFSYEYPRDFRVPVHIHNSAQLVYATRGVMEIGADDGVWLIPPQFAVWIPARVPHRIRMAGSVSMRTLYVRRELARELSQRCAVIHVTPLLRELIIEAVRIGHLRMKSERDGALWQMLLTQLRSASAIPTSIRLPADGRALAVARGVIDDQSLPLQVLCARAGISVRTLERVFQREVGESFETWRRQVRLMKGIEMLVGGASVKEVAFAVGYQQPSAFVEMFRKTLGMTPRAWTAALH